MIKDVARQSKLNSSLEENIQKLYERGFIKCVAITIRSKTNEETFVQVSLTLAAISAERILPYCIVGFLTLGTFCSLKSNQTKTRLNHCGFARFAGTKYGVRTEYS
ncbi:hypothetical protein [Paenibacillus jamilae]|uniref:hypothetical protein n=1 Tax=Paenibacillus jamilae TaxID=114136 RepID=UPI0018D41F5D|nr:hypothetical protein [Paenibacillus jamilae]